jgi:hypothetical protein
LVKCLLIEKDGTLTSENTGSAFDVRVSSAPESVIIRSKEDLYEKLVIGMKQIDEGKVIDADVVMERLKDEYGF